MLFSLAWLRSLCPVDAEVRVAAAALTARGLTVDAVEQRATDTVLDVDVPANRSDCLGHLGLARELGAALATPLAAPPAAPAVDGADASAAVRVEIEAPDLCARYTARIVRDVRVGPSPDWVVQRLEACGLRSINNVVDASNLVMLELGHPIHFFDLERIAGATVRVRRAAEAERLVTLDGVERPLDPDMLVIADGERAVALAGVMGGADSEIHIATRHVLIEAAHFQPASVRRTSRRLGLRSDASHRFERGVDVEGVQRAQDMAARLLAELADGVPAPGTVDAYPRAHEPRELVLRYAELERLLGYRPEPQAAVAALEVLGLAPREREPGHVAVTVPSWRPDLEREADLVEEVARHLGYDAIPTGLAGLPATSDVSRHDDVEERARDLLAAAGLHEAFGYAMIAADEDRPFVAPATSDGLELTNPIAETLARLRRSLLPGLVRAVAWNQRRGVRDVRLFEIGRVFLARKAGRFPVELRRAGIAWSGAGSPGHWSEPEREVDLPGVMGVVEHLLLGLRAGLELDREAPVLRALHPGQSVAWRLPGERRPVAWAGALHPELQGDMPHRLFLAEVELEPLDALPPQVPQYSGVARLTEVTRDLSLSLRPGQRYAEIEAALRAIEAPAATRFHVLDRYEGPPLAEGEISLTVRVILEPRRETLTEPQIEGYRRALIDKLRQELGITVRGAGSDRPEPGASGGDGNATRSRD